MELLEAVFGAVVDTRVELDRHCADRHGGTRCARDVAGDPRVDPLG